MRLRRRRHDAGELLERYRLDQRRRGLSALYTADMGYVVEAFGDYLAPRSPLDASREDVEAWLDSLGIGLGARRNYLGHLHGFFTFAADVTGETEIPTARIRRPKVPRLVPRPVRDEHLRRAFDGAPDATLRAWLLLAAYGGLRCLEIAGLDAEDVDDAGGVLRVRRGKGAKGRAVPLHPEALEDLEAHPMPAAGAVFRMADGRRVPAYVVSQRINRHLDRLGIPSTAHSLRHWYGTRLFRATTDLRLVQELLGHSSPTTTAGYAAWDTRTAAAAVAGLSIRGESAPRESVTPRP